MLLVSMSEGSDLLTVHPVEEAGLSGVAPSVNTSILSERDRVILSQSKVNDLETFFSEEVNEFGAVEFSVLLSALAKDTPVATAEHVQLSII
jgi:hypothetical protein